MSQINHFKIISFLINVRKIRRIFRYISIKHSAYSNYILIKLVSVTSIPLFHCRNSRFQRNIWTLFGSGNTTRIRRNGKSSNSNRLDWQQIKSKIEVEVWNWNCNCTFVIFDILCKSITADILLKINIHILHISSLLFLSIFLVTLNISKLFAMQVG